MTGKEKSKKSYGLWAAGLRALGNGQRAAGSGQRATSHQLAKPEASHIKKDKMIEITKPQLTKAKTLMSKNGLIKFSEELAFSFTDGRTMRVSKMYSHEAWELIQHLEEDNGKQPTSFVKMQRKILSMAHEQNWKNFDGKVNMERVNNWCIKYGFEHKPFNSYTEAELPALVTQFESMYAKHLNTI